MSFTDDAVDMPFVEVGDLDGVVEPEIVEAGDYVLEISKAEHTTSKNNNPMLHISFNIIGSQSLNPKQIHEYFLHITPDDDDKTKNDKKLKFKRLIDCFGITLVDGRLDVAALDGLRGQVTLGVSPATGDYEASNRIRRWHKQ